MVLGNDGRIWKQTKQEDWKSIVIPQRQKFLNVSCTDDGFKQEKCSFSEQGSGVCKCSRATRAHYPTDLVAEWKWQML